MKNNSFLTICACAILSAGLMSCSEKYVTYNDAEYVMFADTAATYVIREDIPSFEVPVVSTVTCSYDRNFAVEIIDRGSSAIEGRDYTLETNNFTIKAGENKALVKVNGNFDMLNSSKEVSFRLRLVMPDRLIFPMGGDQTRVTIRKTCKFRRENFTGWAMVTSVFLYYYSPSNRYQRLIRTVADPEDANSVILKSFLADGYDVSIRFDDETDPLNPSVEVVDTQVISDEASIFGTIHGDNHILASTSPLYSSYFYGDKNAVGLYTRVFVMNIGEYVGTVGDYMNVIEWVSDEEAERLRNEDGM